MGLKQFEFFFKKKISHICINQILNVHLYSGAPNSPNAISIAVSGISEGNNWGAGKCDGTGRYNDASAYVTAVTRQFFMEFFDFTAGISSQ